MVRPTYQEPTATENKEIVTHSHWGEGGGGVGDPGEALGDGGQGDKSLYCTFLRKKERGQVNSSGLASWGSGV